MRKLIIFIMIILTARYSFSLKVYRSLLPIESTDGIAGLHYLKQNNTNASVVNSMTYCLRFKYKRMLRETIIWNIPGPPGHRPLLYVKADYPNYQRWQTFIEETWEMQLFYANQWQHLCIAYDKVNNSLTLTKVNKNNALFLEFYTLLVIGINLSRQVRLLRYLFMELTFQMK